MTFLLTLTATPAARYDAKPETTARLEQAAVAAGPFTTVATIVLAPDADPAKPAQRKLSSNQATIEHGWFRVVFVDADAVEKPTEPVELYLAGDPYAPARRRLAAMLDSSSEPLLDDADVEDLLRRARRPDAAGLAVDAVGWVPTFDFDAAAAAGWLLKAGRAAPLASIASGSQRFERAQIHQHCLAMAAHYRGRLRASLPVTTTTAISSAALQDCTW